MTVHARVAHRKGLEAEVSSLAPSPELFKAIGGRAVVGTLIDALYDRMLADTQLRPKFAADPSMERVKQKAFFEEWLGGEELYAKHYAYRGLRQMHREIHINAQDAKRWLGHFKGAMQDAGIASPLQESILKVLRPLAAALANRDGDPVGKHRCLGEPPATKETLLFRAAGKGQIEVMQKLLRDGADPNVARHVGWGLGMQTPLCHARLKRKKAAAELLREHGAKDDIFTAAALGDLDSLKAQLDANPELANVPDPAQDVYRMTVLHHAVENGQRDAAAFLLDRGAKVGRHSSILVRHAAAHEDVELLRLLLKHGADATRVGPGRWVLHKEIANLLDAHGADVNYAPDKWHSWIWKTCTGNNRNTDSPELVAALIARGAEVNSTKLWGRGALHFAAKAGFTKTVAVLLANGADPNLKDDEGRTPLFYAKPTVAPLLKAKGRPR